MGEAGAGKGLAVQQVLAVHHNGVLGDGGEMRPVEVVELRPFGDHDYRGGVLRDQVRIIDHPEPASSRAPSGTQGS